MYIIEDAEIDAQKVTDIISSIAIHEELQIPLTPKDTKDIDIKVGKTDEKG